MPGESKAVFLSYASEDSEAAARIADALRSAGIEVWFDQSDLRGGDAWDQQIRRQIRECALFIPIVSANTVARREGYFRLEWDLADQRTHMMARDRKFILPVTIDATPGAGADVPEVFHRVQWTRLPRGEPSPAFIERVRQLLTPGYSAAPAMLEADTTHAPGTSRAQRRHSMSTAALWGIGVFAVAAVAYYAAKLTSDSSHPAPSASIAATPSATSSKPVALPEKSIAVLPFVDMSEKHDQEYFADGMSEEILNLLARLPDLRVPARTSSFYFKGRPTPIPEVARQLGVAHVLEGSIRRSGNRIRVTAQLVRANNGFHVWSETYERQLTDVFAVQDDIAGAVVQALQVSLLGGSPTRGAGGTRNLEAYQLYLRARSAGRTNTRAGMARSLDYLGRAVKLDPGFALAWVSMSGLEFQRTESGDLLPKVGYERARQHALHALELAPDLPDARVVLAYVHRVYDWDWPASAAELRSVLAARPNDPFGLQIEGMLAYTLGNWDQAERSLQASVSVDPLNTFAWWNLGTARYLAGRYADAEAAYRRLLEISPEFAWVRSYLARTLLAEGKLDAALAMAEGEPEEINRLDVLPVVLDALGRRAAADAALHTLETKYAATEAYFIATTYAYRGANERALEWLEVAYRQRDSSLVEILGDPLFKPIASDPRYRAFLRKMNLPE